MTTHDPDRPSVRPAFRARPPELVDPLLTAVNAKKADLVVISGDYTQRARVGQYDRSAEFVDRIDAPTLSVPGNHDTPLDNLFMRFLRPFSRYKRAIDETLEPTIDTDTMRVVGLNTVNRYAWQRGRLSSDTIAQMADQFRSAGDRVRVAVLHHPLEHGPETEKTLMKGAEKTLAALAESGADMVLSGHLHTTVLRPFHAAPSCLFVQAGTALSDRLRGDINAFNVIEATRERMEIEVWGAADDPVFDVTRAVQFDRDAGGAWQML